MGPAWAGRGTKWRPLISIAHDEAAVDVDRLARHVVGIAAGEKADDASHVVGRFRPAERDQRSSPLPDCTGWQPFDLAPLGVDLLPHRRVYRTGADAIRCDLVGRKHLPPGARNAANAGFG